MMWFASHGAHELLQFLGVPHGLAQARALAAFLLAELGQLAEIVQDRHLAAGEHRQPLPGVTGRSALVEDDRRGGAVIVQRDRVIAERSDVVGCLAERPRGHRHRPLADEQVA